MPLATHRVEKHDAGDLVEREIGRVTSARIRDDDHGGVFLDIDFRFGGSGQSFTAYYIDPFLLRGILDVFGVEELCRIVGRYALVTRCHTCVHKIEPLLPSDGKPFDADEWRSKCEQRINAIRVANENLLKWR